MNQKGAETSRIVRQLRTYVGRITWIGLDALRSFWLRIVLVLLVNLIGIATTVATFGGLVLYARHLEKGGDDPFRVPVIGVEVSDQPWALAVFAGVLAGLGLLSAACVYYGEWHIAGIADAYQKKSLRRLLRIAADPRCRGWAMFVEGSPRREMARLTGISTKLTALAMRQLLRAILPAATFIVATSVFILVDPMLSVVLLPLVVLYLVPLYFVNRGAARLHRAYTAESPSARSTISNALRLLLDPDVAESRDMAIAERAANDPIHDRVSRLFWRRKLVVQRIQYVNAAFFVLCLIALFAYFAVATTQGERAWTEFLIAIVALRFAFSGVRQVTRRLVKLSRFLPEYLQYSRFVDRAHEMRARRAKAETRSRPLPDQLTIRCGRDGQWESARRISVKRGRVLWIVTDERPTTLHLETLAAVIESRCPELDDDIFTRALIRSRIRLDPSQTLLENALGPDAAEDEIQRFRAALLRLGLSEMVDLLPQGLDTSADDDAVLDLNRHQIATFLIAGLCKRASMVLVDGAAFPKLSCDEAAAMMDGPQPPCLILATDDPDQVFARSFDAVNALADGALVIVEKKILACGDLEWLRAHREAIIASLAEAQRPRDLDDAEETEFELIEDDE